MSEKKELSRWTRLVIDLILLACITGPLLLLISCNFKYEAVQMENGYYTIRDPLGQVWYEQLFWTTNKEQILRRVEELNKEEKGKEIKKVL